MDWWMLAAPASNFVRWLLNKLPKQVAPPAKVVDMKCLGPSQKLPGEISDGLVDAGCAGI